MNKKLKIFNEIKTTENLKQKILNQTINIEKGIKPKKTIKLAYGLGVFVLILFISCTVVFAAGYIRTFFTSFSRIWRSLPFVATSMTFPPNFLA